MLMVHAVKRGLAIGDFYELSIGMILDYLEIYDEGNQEREPEKIARQNEFNSF